MEKMEKLNNIFEIWNKVYNQFSLTNFFKKTWYIFPIYIIIGNFLYIYLKEKNYNLIIGILILIFSSLILFFHIKHFLEKIEKQYSLQSEKYKFFSDYYLNYKYQLLKKYFNEKNLKITSSDITLVKDYVNTKNLPLVEKNPIFVVSFAILLAILSSGNLDKGKDIYILAFFFMLSILGIVFSFQLHPLFAFNKDKQLLFLLEILVNEN